MKQIYLFLITLLIGSFGFSQTTIAYQGFEENAADTWTTTFSTAACSSGGDVWDYSTSLSSISPSAGSQFWGISDLNGNCGSSSGESITFSNTTVSGYTSISIIFDYRVNGFDTNDDIFYTVSLDGIDQTEIQLVNGDGNFSTSGYATETINIPDGTNTVGLQVRVTQNGSDYAGLDNFILEGIAGATCTAPTAQASAYNTTSLGTTSATLNWTYGDGDEVLVVVKEGSAVDTDPEIGTTYTGNTVFTSGDQIGTGNYVVQSGSATSSVSITGLSEATTYHVAVYEYNTIDTCYELTELTGNFTTECSTPSEVYTFTATAGNEEVDLTWSNGSCFDEILVIAKETSAVTVTPTGDGSAYTANATFGSSADLGTSEYAVYKGIGTSVTVTGLTNGNTYHFSVFTRKATSWSAAVADDATLACTAPAIQASTFTTLSPTTTDVSIEFTRGGGDDVLVVMKEGSAVDTDPTSGTSYNANSIFNGSGASEIGTGNYVVFNGNNGTSNPGTGGSSLSISVSGLNPNTTYHLAIYEYNTTNTCYNLIEFTGDFTTVCSTPSDVTAFTAEEGTTEVDLTWSNGSCFDEILVIAKETSAVSVTPTGDGSTYTANTEFGSGSDLGIGEYVVYKGTGTSVTVTGLTFGTTYHFEVFARKATTWSSGVTDNATPNYCEPNPSSVDGTGITNVTIGTIDNTTGAEAGNYGDYSAQSTDLAQGQLVACDITFTTGYSYNTKIWIDYNNDGDFDDLDEEVYSGISASESTTTLNASFTIPISTSLGQYRLRIGSSEGEGFGGTVIPCYTGVYGAYEDYTINVIAASTDTTVQFTTASATVSEGVGTYDLEFSITNEDALNATTFDVALTTGDASDINTYTTQTVTFPANSNTNQTLTITVTDDAVLEADETLTFTIQNVAGGNNAALGILNTFDLTITNNDLPPPTSLPYSEDFSDCGAAEWTPYDEAGNDEWICSGNEYAINGYSSTDDTDWLISDFSIDFSAYSSVKIDVTTQEQYGDNINTPGEFELLYSTDYSGGDPTIATWTALSFDPNNTEFSGGLSSPSVTSVDASGITGVAYIAFKYDMNYGNGAEDWRVQNIDIYEDIALDIDTEIFAPSNQIELLIPITAADVTTSGTAEDAFGFIIEDQGTADDAPTNVTTMRFVPGPNNTADWADHIQGITLYDENLVDYTPITTITDSEIILEFDTPISIADGASLEFVFGFYLNTTNIVDGSIIQFQIDESASGFESNEFGSDFANPLLLGDVVGNNFTIDVYVTELIFSQEPSNTFVNTAMTPDISVAAVDANGNIDTSYDLDIEITSTGTLTGSPLVATPVNGVATFLGLTHTALGTALVLTADDDLYPTVNSSTFDIEAIPVGPVVIAIQDFDGTTPEWTYINNVSFFDNDWGNGGYYGIIDISAASPINQGNMSNNILGENDLENSGGNGTTGFATTTFATIDILAYENVELTFDWDVVGYNANNDDARYEVFYDGVGQGIVYLLDGNGSPTTDEGTVTVLIPNTVSNVSLEIEIRNNGGSGYSGFDNFKLEGEVISTSTTYTYNGSWSPSDPNGAATASDDIVIASGDATIDINTTANSVTVNAGAGLTVDTGVTLTVTNGLALGSVSNSYSSLILNGTVAGAVSYQRHINNAAESGVGTGSNDLVSPPLTGQSFGAFRMINTNILSGEIGGTGTIFYLFSPFDTAGNEYTYYSESDDSETLDAGNGYRTGSTSPGDQDTYTFSGTVETATVTKSIVAPAASNWNLIGNPYPSYFKIEEFLLDNIAQFDFSSSGIYGYDGLASDGWDIWNLARAQDPTNAGAVIAPGQGFFVASIPAGGSVTFDPDHRVTGTSDDFISGRSTNSITNLELTLNNSSASFITDIYFTASATQSLDPGYDSSLFKSQINDFSLYSHLVMDNTNVPLAIQSLGETDYTDVTIPLGVHALQGEQLTFSISASTLPSTVSVYLEDNVANTSTLLNTNDYVLTPSTALSGIGRFYLRVSNSTLSTVDHNLDQLSIYTNKADKTIVIAGQLLEPTTASVYDVQGRLVSTTQLQTTVRSQAIDVSNLSLGIYVVKLHNAAQNKTQKVIIR